MTDTLLDLPTVTTDQRGDLALTLFLFASVVLMGTPMELGRAWMRRTEMPVARLLASFGWHGIIDGCSVF